APDHPPEAGGKEAIKDAYRSQMKIAEVVIVLSSLYLENEFWVAYQMDAAQASELPLVVLPPFGGTAKVPAELQKRAAAVVDWNGRGPAGGVRFQARHENTARWDVIEFKM